MSVCLSSELVYRYVCLSVSRSVSLRWLIMFNDGRLLFKPVTLGCVQIYFVTNIEAATIYSSYLHLTCRFVLKTLFTSVNCNCSYRSATCPLIYFLIRDTPCSCSDQQFTCTWNMALIYHIRPSDHLLCGETYLVY
jgi:hypothetical protein